MQWNAALKNPGCLNVEQSCHSSCLRRQNTEENNTQMGWYFIGFILANIKPLKMPWHWSLKLTDIWSLFNLKWNGRRRRKDREKEIKAKVVQMSGCIKWPPTEPCVRERQIREDSAGGSQRTQHPWTLLASTNLCLSQGETQEAQLMHGAAAEAGHCKMSCPRFCFSSEWINSRQSAGNHSILGKNMT